MSYFGDYVVSFDRMIVFWSDVGVLDNPDGPRDPYSLVPRHAEVQARTKANAEKVLPIDVAIYPS